MPEPIKNFFSPRLVRLLAADITRVEPAFPAQAFIRQATAGLEELELLGRARHIARALGEHLPRDYPRAVDVLLRSVGRKYVPEEQVISGMEPFFYMPHTLFVAEYGLEHFELSLKAQHQLTKRFSAEFSIRPFIAKDPERIFAQLLAWTTDPDPLVRRLCSEGTRSRLPWALRVAWLDANPKRVLELLERLRDDSASVVRRSVANNLNDLGKVHPDLVVQTCHRWLKGASPELQQLVRHALRSLIKKAHPGALSLLGNGSHPQIEITQVRLAPSVIHVGDELRFSFLLRSAAAHSQELLVDFTVHFVKANGSLRPKTFKLKKLTLAGNATAALEGKISFAAMSTRRHYPGRHHLEALVNGIAYPLASFDLRP